MAAFMVFFEGVMSFISPCVLPMLPIYLLYLGAGAGKGGGRLFINTLGFVLGFTVIFVLLGVSATTIGQALTKNKQILARAGGAIMILLGLNFAGVIRIGFLNRELRPKANVKDLGFLKAVLFGFTLAIGWSPCIGTFLSAALMLAASGQTLWRGMFLLFIFSLGLGLPFIISALAFERLAGAFDFIKKHQSVVNAVSGALLVAFGLLLLFNIFGYYEALFVMAKGAAL